MSIEISNPREPQNGNCNDAAAETATQKAIHQLKENYCKKLKVKVAELNESEVTYDGAVMVYEKKKCAFVKTEKNYLLVRNLELRIGVEVIQASDEIKKNVTAYQTQNDALIAALKAVVKTAQDTKAKFGELREAADKLGSCKTDSAYAVQLKILGCNAGDDCNDQVRQEQMERKPDSCRNVCKILDELISIPGSLSQDIDIIGNAAAEIVGIQSFSNIGTLTRFQQDFAGNAKAFDELIQLQLTSGGISLKKAQDDLTQSIKNVTQAGYALYNKRNEVQTEDKTKDYLCCHKCKCIAGCGCEDENGEEDNRLKKCKCDICDICKEVTEIYSCDTPSANTSID